MEYKANDNMWADVFAVPAAVTDRFLRTIDEASLKVLLWALRHSGEYYNDEMISAGSGVSEDEAGRAMAFWINSGVLNIGSSGTSAAAVQNPAVSVPSAANSEQKAESSQLSDSMTNEVRTEKNETAPSGVQPNTVAAQNQTITETNAKRLDRVKGTKLIRPDPGFMAIRMSEDENVLTLVREAESLLGKTISPTLSAVLLSAYDDLNMPIEVIITLLGYCKTAGKLSIQYIESVIEDWGQSGVDSMEAAEQKLQDIEKHNSAWKLVVRLFSIPYRQPSKKESDFCYSWVHEMKLSETLIKEAYERCIDNTGKLQFSYINKILTSWNQNNLKTITDVLDYEAKHRSSKSSVSSSSINYDDLENFGIFSDMDK